MQLQKLCFLRIKGGYYSNLPLTQDLHVRLASPILAATNTIHISISIETYHTIIEKK